MDGNVSVIQALINARNPSVWNATQTVMMQRFIDRIVCYAGDFNEVVAENQQELSRLLEVRGESSDNASEFMLTAAPKMMVKVVQSMLDAAVESRKSMLDVAQLVDANIGEKPAAAPAAPEASADKVPAKAPRRKAAPRKTD